MKVTIEAQTDVGRVRELNEDNYQVVADQNTVVVCDGMGGHAAGEVASTSAVHTISDLMTLKPAQIAETIFPQLEHPLPQNTVMLAAAIRVANRRVYNAAAKSQKLRGMGTTVVAAVFSDGVVSTAHVGDSRAYRIVNGGIEPLTIDHSWVAELVQSGQVKPEDAENFADKNVITRALGTRPNVLVDVAVYPASPGELYLLCSDGVCGYVSDDDILRIVMKYGDDLQAAGAGLIAAANAAGGLDNSTVALVRIEETEPPSEEYKSGPWTLPEESKSELEILDALIKERYPDVETPAEAPALKRVTTDPDFQPGGDEEGDGEDDEGSGGGFRWGWIFVALAVAAVAAIFLWPRIAPTPGGDEAEVTTPAPDTTLTRVPAEETGVRPPLVVTETETPRETEGAPPPEVVQSDAVVNLVAFGEARHTGVYWDGVYRGRVSELEMGMPVTPGEHRLVVVAKAGDTLLDRRITVFPNDTLDLEVTLK